MAEESATDTLHVLWVTPHGRHVAERRGWSTRPAQLAIALARRGVRTTILARTTPHRTLLAIRRVRPILVAGWPLFVGRDADAPRGIRLLEHGVPPGWVEDRLVEAVTRGLRPAPSVAIVTDPRSARTLRSIRGAVRVFDAYDAWDASPLYAESPRRVQEIRAGYQAAARNADLITTNTPVMADRLRGLGARDVRLLPNGAPVVLSDDDRSPVDIIYLGNIQPRVRVDLLRAAADVAAARKLRLRIAGEVQVLPPGWEDLLSHPAVTFLGPRFGGERDALLRSAAVGLVPHVVDAYTLSQDTMKAWDYLAYGIPVVGTDVPPLSSVRGVGTVATSPADFARAVSAALDSDSSHAAAARRELARQNDWNARARSLLAFLEEVTPRRPVR